MKRSLSSANDGDTSPPSQHHQRSDSNTFTNEQRPNTAATNELNDLSSPQQQPTLTPKTILRSQQQGTTGGNGKTVTIHSQPEIIQLQSNTKSLNSLSNPCYFASAKDTVDQFDIEQQIDNTVVISIRGAQNGKNNTNNNNNCGNNLAEATRF